MAEERDEEQFGKQDETGQAKQQQPTGAQSQQPPTGEQSQPQPTGQQGQSSSGQTDLGQGGDTATLSGEQRGFGAGCRPKRRRFPGRQRRVRRLPGQRLQRLSAGKGRDREIDEFDDERPRPARARSKTRTSKPASRRAATPISMAAAATSKPLRTMKWRRAPFQGRGVCLRPARGPGTPSRARPTGAKLGRARIRST